MKRKAAFIIVSMILIMVETLSVFAHPDRTSEWQGFILTSKTSPADSYKSARTRAIQTILKLCTDYTAFSTIDLDGSFGPITHDEVVRFQNNENINNNGKVGSVTWTRLYYKLGEGSYSAGHYWYYLSTGLGGGDDTEEAIIRRGDPSGKWQVINFDTNGWITFEFAY